MSEFEVLPISEMPTPTKNTKGAGLVGAVQKLGAGEAIFVPAKDGGTMERLTTRVASNLTGMGAHTRRDRERGGIWIYKNGAS